MFEFKPGEKRYCADKERENVESEGGLLVGWSFREGIVPPELNEDEVIAKVGGVHCFRK